MDRPEWLDNNMFMKMIATIFHWYGKDQERADEALVKLFGRSGTDVEVSKEGRITFMKKRRLDKYA